MLEKPTVVYPPNRALDRVIKISTVPIIYDFMLFIDFNEKGEAILGTGNLNDTFWEGTLLHFNNSDVLEALKYDKHYIGSTVSDGKFLTEDMIVLGEDTGNINILQIENTIISKGFYKEADRISKVAIWPKTGKILTCSGTSVAIWDINNKIQKPSHYFQNYHTQLVNYVDTLQSEPNIFVSASTDRKCCIWDTRNSSPAQVLYSNEFSTCTSVAFNQKDTNYIVVGTEAGDLYLLDKREPKEFVSVANCNFNIYRIVFNDSNKVAVCGDSNKVLVFQCDEQKLTNIYSNERHSGIVRGLRWQKDDLFSCGFDKNVIKHSAF